jgi:valyl-tRNA synthetase
MNLGPPAVRTLCQAAFVPCDTGDARDLIGQLEDVAVSEYDRYTKVEVSGRTFGYVWEPTGTVGLKQTVAEQAALVASLTRATPVVAERAPQGAAAHAVLADGSEVVIPLAGLVDLEKECAKIRAELAGLEKQLAALEQRLANPSFVAKAKPEIVAAERQKLGDWQTRREQLAQKVKSLCGA